MCHLIHCFGVENGLIVIETYIIFGLVHIRIASAGSLGKSSEVFQCFQYCVSLPANNTPSLPCILFVFYAIFSGFISFYCNES